MSEIKKLTVDISYFDPKVAPYNEPREIAERCKDEIIDLHDQVFLIREQFSLLPDQLINALTKKDIRNVIVLCQFNYENLLFRKYILRERVWDILAALTSTKREDIRKDKVKKEVYSKIKTNFQELYEAFSVIWQLIRLDGKLRTTATHLTNLDVHFKQNGNIVHKGLLLGEFDCKSKDSVRVQELVRQSIENFITQKRQHIQKVCNAIIEFSIQCDIAFCKKNWDK